MIPAPLKNVQVFDHLHIIAVFSGVVNDSYFVDRMDSIMINA